ncbi:multidrug efflux RND transporter permease subunit, partial [Enterobacter sp. 63]
RKVIRRAGAMMLLFVVLLVGMLFAFRQVPSAFLPEEDQGYYMSAIQLPADATSDRTMQPVKAFEKYISGRKAIESNLVVLGYGFSGSGPNAALAYTTLKDWGEREGTTSQDEANNAQAAMSIIKEGSFMSLLPPAIDELGTSSGFTLRIEDRANRGYEALMKAQDQLLAAAAKSSIVAQVYPDSLPGGNSITLNIDRQKAQALGVSFTNISDTLSSAMGSLYVNDFPNKGRMEQVIIQADAPYRMQLEDVLKLYVRNQEGGMVSMREVVNASWSDSPLQLTRYQGFLAARISGSASPGPVS